MGVAASSTAPQAKSLIPTTYFIIDRILAANCEFLPNHKNPNITLGIHKNPTPENPLGRQGIRIGDSEILSLKNFQKHETGILYEFDNSTSLNVFKRINGKEACFHLRTPTLNVTQQITPIIAKHFKDISCDSKELDTIKEILQ